MIDRAGIMTVEMFLDSASVSRLSLPGRWSATSSTFLSRSSSEKQSANPFNPTAVGLRALITATAVELSVRQRTRVSRT